MRSRRVVDPTCSNRSRNSNRLNFNRKEGKISASPLSPSLAGMSQIGRDAKSTFFPTQRQSYLLQSSDRRRRCSTRDKFRNAANGLSHRPDNERTDGWSARKPLSFSWAMPLWMIRITLQRRCDHFVQLPFRPFPRLLKQSGESGRWYCPRSVHRPRFFDPTDHNSAQG